MFKFFRHIKSGTIHIFGAGVNANWDDRRAVCGEPLYSKYQRHLYGSYEKIDDNFSKHSAEMLCVRCVSSLFSAGKYKLLVKLLSSICQQGDRKIAKPSNMVKVLINDYHDGQIHLSKERFENSSARTLCGRKLHPISTTYTPKLGVTCDKCLGIHTAEGTCQYCFNTGKGDCQMC
jgi:hypothetical protein